MESHASPTFAAAATPGAFAGSNLLARGAGASIARVGAVAAFGLALAYVATGVTAILMPPALTYGAIGVWVGVVSWLGLRDRLLPRGVAWLGLAAAATYLAGVAGYAFAIRPLLVVAIGVGGLGLVPAWYAALGVVLRGAAQRA